MLSLFKVQWQPKEHVYANSAMKPCLLNETDPGPIWTRYLPAEKMLFDNKKKMLKK